MLADLPDRTHVPLSLRITRSDDDDDRCNNKDSVSTIQFDPNVINHWTGLLSQGTRFSNENKVTFAVFSDNFLPCSTLVVFVAWSLLFLT